jgi:hypothetical protein
MSTHFLNFSKGKRASNLIVSNSISAKQSVVEGPHVFSGAMDQVGNLSEHARAK